LKGHIRQRSKGSWTLWIDLGRDGETGKRKQQTLTVRGSKKDAERELRVVLTRIEGGAHVKPAKMTVGEYLETWLRDYVATNTAPSTADGYSDIVKAHLIPVLGSLLLTALQPSHIQAFYSRMSTATSHNWWKFDLTISYTLLPSQSIPLSNQYFF